MPNQIYIENACDVNVLSSEAIELVETVVNTTLNMESVPYPCAVNVAVVDEEEIRELNSEHRSIDRVTDVLSFPVVNLIDGSYEENAGDFYDGYLILGDVVLCSQRAREQSEEFGHSYERELGYLCCHSILHLIGYDHETDEEREIMRQKEEAVMQSLNLKR